MMGRNNAILKTRMNSFRLTIVAVFAASAVANADVQVPGAFDSGFENQAGLVFSPDGKTAYWAAWNGVWGSRATSPRTIYSSDVSAGAWSEPAALPFSGTFNDDDPYVSPDGRWLYFVSDRPRVDGDSKTDGDIWRYSLGDDGEYREKRKQRHDETVSQLVAHVQAYSDNTQVRQEKQEQKHNARAGGDVLGRQKHRDQKQD